MLFLPLRSPLLLVAAVAVLATQACWSPPVDQGAVGPEIWNFSASEQNLPPGGGLVTLSWDVRNASEVVLLPEGEAVERKGTMVVSVSETRDFVLRASSRVGEVQRSLSVHVRVGSTRVQGRVLDETGAVAPGVTLTFVGGPTVSADESGDFTARVDVPYDVVITDPNPERARRVYAWRGLTTATPTLLTSADYSAPKPARTRYPIRLKWSGGLSGPDMRATAIVVGQADTNFQWPPPPALESYDDRWVAGLGTSGEITADVLILQYAYDDDEGGPDYWFDHQRLGVLRGVVLQPGIENDLGEVALEPITMPVTTVTIEGGDWSDRVIATTAFALPGRAAHELDTVGSSLPTFQVPQLPVPEAAQFVRGLAIDLDEEGSMQGYSSASKTRVDPETNAVVLRFMDYPRFVSPLPGETISRSAPLRWTTAEPGLCRVTLSSLAEGVYIFTTRRELEADFRNRLVDPSARWSDYQWEITCFDVFTSTDEAAASPDRVLELLRGAPAVRQASTLPAEFRVE